MMKRFINPSQNATFNNATSDILTNKIIVSAVSRKDSIYQLECFSNLKAHTSYVIVMYVNVWIENSLVESTVNPAVR